MIFSSFEFIFLFLPITFGVYFYLNKKNLIKLATSFLVFSSLFFYSWWNIVYLPLILFSVVINFLTGKFLLKKISKFTTIILITHDSKIINLADKIYFIKDGNISNQ